MISTSDEKWDYFSYQHVADKTEYCETTLYYKFNNNYINIFPEILGYMFYAP